MTRFQWAVRYRNYIRSEKWKAKSRACVARAGGVCERCGGVNRLQSHHITYAHLGNERPWELECLCRWCHRNRHRLSVKETVEVDRDIAAFQAADDAGLIDWKAIIEENEKLQEGIKW